METDRDVGNPSRLSEGERTDLGISQKLPTTIEQSLEALDKDVVLREALGSEVVDHFVAMKRAEQLMLDALPEPERRVWLMERY